MWSVSKVVGQSSWSNQQRFLQHSGHNQILGILVKFPWFSSDAIQIRLLNWSKCISHHCSWDNLRTCFLRGASIKKRVLYLCIDMNWHDQWQNRLLLEQCFVTIILERLLLASTLSMLWKPSYPVELVINPGHYGSNFRTKPATDPSCTWVCLIKEFYSNRTDSKELSLFRIRIPLWFKIRIVWYCHIWKFQGIKVLPDGSRCSIVLVSSLKKHVNYLDLSFRLNHNQHLALRIYTQCIQLVFDLN